MMKRLITIALLLGSLGVFGQTNEPLPGDAEPLTNQLYLSPSDSTVWAADPFSGLAINLGSWWKVDSLFKLGYTKGQVDSVLNRNYYTKPEVDSKFTLGPKSFNIIGAGDSDDPILIFNDGDWDEKVSEIGNVIFDTELNTYFFVYSGFSGSYTGGNCYIGLASSADGDTWTKQGQITPIGHEDPYLLKHDGQYYLYTEKKSGNTHLGINLFTGEDVQSLSDGGLVLTSGTGWESQDVSSPTAIIIENEFYLYYEGRGVGQGGAIGLATSPDGVTFTRNGDNPIVKGINLPNPSYYWASHCVPDGIIELDGLYYMTLHAYNGQSFAAGLMASNDLINWFDGLGTWITTGKQNYLDNGEGISLYLQENRLTALYAPRDGQSVFKGFFSVKVGETSSYIGLTSASFADIFPANRNSFIRGFIESGTYILRNDPLSGAGISKVFKNTASTDVTITPEADVTLNGTSDPITVRPGESVNLVSNGVNSWIVWINDNLVDKSTDQTSIGGDKEWVGSSNYWIPSSTTAATARPHGMRYYRQTGQSSALLRAYDGAESDAWILRNYSSSGVQFTLNKGDVAAPGYRLSALNTPPSSATDTGTTGEIRFGTDGRIYICTATNTWIRSEPLTTW